jgi:hypothetical protein
LVQLEFVILIVPYLIGYLPSIQPAIMNDSGNSAFAPTAPSFCGFVGQVFSVWDVFNVMEYKDSMKQDLTQK